VCVSVTVCVSLSLSVCVCVCGHETAKQRKRQGARALSCLLFLIFKKFKITLALEITKVIS